jgi:2-oxoglutarate ferredoxin oxidoreductase subunit beta
MNTFGFHTIHGRAPAFATGLKCTNPDLSVWVITGDGDALSIGGNHFIHLLRRNLDVKVVLFNNKIYGLTKGQYSPTSDPGTVTKSTPYGSVDRSFQVASLSIGAEATFFARTLDTDPNHMKETFLRAAAHKGTAVVEVLQNCVVFNDKVFDPVTNRETREDAQLKLKHGEPMRFGKDSNKGVRLSGLSLEIVTIGEDGASEADILVHDETRADPTWAYLLSRMALPDLPTPLGVFRAVSEPTYNDAVLGQIKEIQTKKGSGDLNTLFHSGDTWTVV